MAESLSIFPDRSRLRVYMIATGICMAVSLGVMFSLEQIMHRDLRLIALIVATLGCLSFGYGFLYNIMRLRQPQPLLQADAEGLWWHVSLMNFGKVEWADVIGYEVVKHGMSKKVLVKVKRPELYTEKYPGIRKLTLRNALKRYGTPVVLPLSLFEGDILKTLKDLANFGEGRGQQPPSFIEQNAE
jgi:hypothetical protein